MASVRRCFVQGVGADLYGFSMRNVGEEAGNVKGTEENRGGRESKVSDFFKGERIRHAVGG